MRWSPPRIDVDCTGKPICAAAATIQSVSTPPPSPPSAAMRIVIGRGCGPFMVIIPHVSRAQRGAPRTRVRISCSRLGGRAYEPADHRLTYAMEHAIPPGGVADDLGAIERRT